MSAQYSFIGTFNEKFSNPDLFDAGGATVGGVDQFFAELGKLAKGVQGATFTATDAQQAKAVLQKFAAGINLLNLGIAQVGTLAGSAQDAKFARAFKSLVSNVNLHVQQFTYAADEVIAGNPSSFPKLSAAASSVFKNVGGLIGFALIGNEFYQKGLTAQAVDGAGETALGVLSGLAGAEAAALVTGGVLTILGAPAVVTAAATIATAFGVGYAAGMAGESLWEPSRWWFENEFLPGVFDAGTEAYNTISIGLSDLSVSMGKFDGTWLEGLDATKEQKAAFTTLLAGASQLSASQQMNVDLQRLLEAPSNGSSLLSRDLLIRTVLQIAQEQGAYVSERVSVSAGVVSLSVPASATQALTTLRRLAEASLSEYDKAGFALSGADRVVVSPTGGTLAGESGNDLLIGGSAVDGLIGGSGHDELIAGAGADTLLGQEGSDALFGGSDNDHLDGGIGSDYLYGGAGTDTYNFTGTFGSDWIADSDGLGRVVVDGVTLTGQDTRKVAEGVYSDGSWIYSLVSDGNGGQDLILQRDSSLNNIRIRNWSAERSLGITLSDTAAEPSTALTLVGDFIKATNDTGTAYQTTANGYVTAGVSPGAADVLNGSTEADLLQGLGGNDGLAGGAGDDILEGGEGDDLLLGGSGSDIILGGAGDDEILGSDNGRIDRPSATDATPPASSGEELSRGFSWVVYDPPGEGGTIVVGAGDIYPNGETTGNIIDGGSGNDRIGAGSGADVVHGGADDDAIVGMGQGDVLHGDGGNDRILGDGSHSLNGYYTPAAEHGNDTLIGGDGDDALRGQGRDDALYGGADNDFLYGDDTDLSDTPGSIHGDDWLDGGLGNDQLYGGGRDDWLIGGAGNDKLWGDDAMTVEFGLEFHGADHLDGGEGDDYLEGGAKDDTLLGGTGNDVLLGDGYNVNSQGNDYLDGGSGDDTLLGQAGSDTLVGGEGNDNLTGDDANISVALHKNDYLDGGAGDDVLFGQGGSDTLLGGEDNDFLSGDDTDANVSVAAHGNDYLNGETGDDILVGGGLDDKLFGGTGNDVLYGDATEEEVPSSYHGNDYLDGGEGNDVLSGQGGEDQLSGGAGNDTLVGGDGDDYLDGDGGTDALLGGEGNDTLISDGRDYLDGGAGDDTFIIDAVASGVVATVDDAAGANTVLIGGASLNTAKVFMQDGQWYLTTGAERLVALGANASLNGLLLADPGTGTSKTIQAIVNEVSSDGLARSGRWSAGVGVTFTADVAAAQNIVGSARAEWLQGGSGSDDLDGNAGSDRMEGGAGADLLRGGAGADTLRGGRGDDTLEAGRDGQNDADQDVYAFASGDGTDFIVNGSVPTGAGKDVIRFDAGITRANISASAIFSSDAADATARVLISYGANDRIALDTGVEGSINRLEFADGTSMSMAEVLALISSPANGSIATEGDDFILGTAGDDLLFGRGGDDTLTGGAGNDSLEGGKGSNTYRFSTDSGDDLIKSSVDESGLLVFEGMALSEISARLEGDNLVIETASGSKVQVIDFGRIGAAASSWQVKASDASPVNVADLLTSDPQPADPTYADRRQRFLTEQRVELRTLPQRAFEYQGAVPQSVEQLNLSANGALVLPNYLVEDAQTISVTQRTRRPIYQSVNSLDSNTASDYRYLNVFNIPSGTYLPPGTSPVYGPDPNGGYGTELMGYLIPTPSSSFSKTTASARIVGYEEVSQTYEQTVPNDSAIQMLVTASSGADVIQSFETGIDEYGYEFRDDLRQFRGSIEAGAGDDVIQLVSYQNSSSPGELYGDWIPVPYPFNTFYTDRNYERGKGAWIDAGAGDDVVQGTDGHDTIIGGGGSDLLNGQAGADTYIVRRDGISIDRISDSAAFIDESGGLFETYGGSLSDAHEDTIEFDHTVERGQLSYRWINSNTTLELFQAGQIFLQISYADDGSAGRKGSIGIERFVFDDGQAFSLNQLLQLLPMGEPSETSVPPLLLQPLVDLVLNEHDSLDSQSLDTFFSDPQNGELVFSASLADGDPLPSWLNFNTSTGVFSGTPDNADVGQLSLQLKATNSAGLSTIAAMSIIIVNVNDAPVPGFALPETLEVQQNQAFEWMLPSGSFVDIDAGDSLQYRAMQMNGDPLPDWIEIDPLSGNLNGFPPEGAAGSLAITIEAYDQSGTTATQVISLTIRAPQPNVIYGTSGADNLQGTALSDVLVGLAGNDTMTGLQGDDSYIVEDLGDVVVESVGEGDDHIEASVSWVLPENVERLTLTGSMASNATGNDLANTLIGNGSHNVLDGKAGADVMTGGASDDTYFVDASGDRTIEQAGGGTDDTHAFVNWTLSEHVENLFLRSSAHLTGTGNSLDNTITGNSGNNTIAGLGGNDVLDGRGGNDTIVVAAGFGADTVIGFDAIAETTGAQDLIDLRGFAAITTSNFASHVSLSATGTGGVDTLVTVAGDGTLTLSGVALADVSISDFLIGPPPGSIVGNGNANVLNGTSAADSIYGLGGNDTLDGKAGADTMVGGSGNDTYFVDASGDRTIEEAGGGTDDTHAFVNWTLAEHVDNLFLRYSADLTGTGNSLDNTITGNSGNNMIAGLAGNDVLDGRGGDDIYEGGQGNDSLIDNSTSSIDVYRLGHGDGSDTVTDSGGAGDRIELGTDIGSDQLWFRQVGSDLEVSVIGTNDLMQVKNWYSDASSRIEQFRTTDGAMLLEGQVQNLVDAMASFAPPGAGQTTLPDNYRTALGSTIAANWQPQG